MEIPFYDPLYNHFINQIMNIALLADYDSAEYQLLYDKVKNLFPEETVLDLSRHRGSDWKKRDQARVRDIEDAHLVFVCNDWQINTDIRHDLREAQCRKKDIVIEYERGYVPFNI